MDVFSAFPNAVIYDRWQISQYQQGTILGTVFDVANAKNLDVIVDEADDTTISAGTNAQPLNADLLLYAKPDQLPTTNTRQLVAGYILYDSENNDYFAIINAAVGKNQETGEIEHIELLVKQTEIAGLAGES